MRANLLHTQWIILRSILSTLRISLGTLFDAARGKSDRERADQRLRWWSRKLLGYVGLEYEVIAPPGGVPIPEGRPCIVMTNHSSLYDIPLSALAVPGTLRMLTKKELFRVPIWGRAMRAAEMVSIDRTDRRQAIRDLEAAKEKMLDGVILWVAPEGTRSRDGSLGRFKKGGFVIAIETGAVILPMGIRGANDVLPAKSLRFRMGKRAEVRFGRPIDAAAYGMERRDALMADVEAAIRELADLPAPSPGPELGDTRASAPPATGRRSRA